MNKAPEIIRIEDWEKFGEGNTADTFFDKKTGTKMLKLYKEDIDAAMGFDELEKTEAVSNLGIPVPKALAFVSCGNRFGGIYETIQGKKSFYKAMAAQPERTEEIAKIFASAAKKLHSTQCNTEIFPSMHDYFSHLIAADSSATASQKERAYKYLDSFPKETSCIHGDLHFSNIVFDKDENVLFIDLPEFSYGNHLLDFGMAGILLNYTPEEKVLKDTHITKEHLVRAWSAFFTEYLGTDDPRDGFKLAADLAGLVTFRLAQLFPGSPKIKQIFSEHFGE